MTTLHVDVNTEGLMQVINIDHWGIAATPIPDRPTRLRQGILSLARATVTYLVDSCQDFSHHSSQAGYTSRWGKPPVA